MMIVLQRKHSTVHFYEMMKNYIKNSADLTIKRGNDLLKTLRVFFLLACKELKKEPGFMPTEEEVQAMRYFKDHYLS